MVFFPCIYFCDAKNLFLNGQHIAEKKWSMKQKAERALHESEKRQSYYTLLWKLVATVDERGLRCIIENPWNVNGQSFLQLNFIPPAIIDKNRMERGDYYVKQTAYWFIGCERTFGFSMQHDKERKIVMKGKRHEAGLCGEDRSMISPDYARNFICDFILGIEQQHTLRTLF